MKTGTRMRGRTSIEQRSSKGGARLFTKMILSASGIERAMRGLKRTRHREERSDEAIQPLRDRPHAVFRGKAGLLRRGKRKAFPGARNDGVSIRRDAV